MSTDPNDSMAETILQQTATNIADELVQRVAEFDDRMSPDDFPEALLLTSEELHALLMEMAKRIIAARTPVQEVGRG